ncbi:MAG: oxidoreductase [Kiritimatiellaceae bacterium TMED266]|nr:MAG: oxidoreductase [Kiritimatiellaceae bacterium TMED266]
MSGFSRRESVLGGSIAAGLSLIPGSVLGANERVNVAWIGVSRRGNRLLSNFTRSDMMNVVALCDVDPISVYMQEAATRFPRAKVYRDWRTLFDECANEFDAVAVMVPDHSHFPITMAAMALGKHVYTEKPLARTFEEVSLLMAAAERYGVVTQMGNQGFSGDNYFQFKAWKEAGIIKNVRHIDAHINLGRSWIRHHADPHHAVDELPRGETKPLQLDWDGWLAATPDRPYSSYYHRYNWRGWFQYGTGAFGDWGAHIFDSIHHFLQLGMPESIEVKKCDHPHPYIFPSATTLRFAFPARDDEPPLTVDYYDGVKNYPPIPDSFEGRSLNLNKDPGKFIYSDELTFQGLHHGSPLQVIPYEKMRQLLAEDALPRNFGRRSDHYANFLLACKGVEQTRSPFSIAGPLTQFLLLGALAQRMGEKGLVLAFDREKQQFTNSDLANAYLKDVPRAGWEQYYTL